MRARRSAHGSQSEPAAADHGSVPTPRSLRPLAVERWSAALAEAAGGAVDRSRLDSPRRWPGPRVDLTPSDIIDPAAVRMLLGGRSVRLSQLVVPAAFPDVARRVQVVDRAARAARERYGLDLLRIVLGTVTWDPEDDAAARVRSSTDAADDPGAPVLPGLVARIELSPRLGDDLDLVVPGPWELPPGVLDRVARAGTTIDPVAIVGSDGVGRSALDRSALDRLAEAGAAIPGFRVNQRVLVGVLPLLGRAATDDLVRLPELLARSTGEEPGGPFDLVAALAADPDAAGEVRRVGLAAATGSTDDLAGAPFAVMAADAGQRAVVEAAEQGGHVLVGAPPGTGTARTIVDLVATFAARGRSVLVVSEEAAPLRRIADLLAEVGLGDLVFDVASAGPPETRSGRRLLAELLADRIAGWAGTHGAPADPERRRILELERTLEHHDRALHTRREPWGVTVHEIIGELLELDRVALRAGGSGAAVDLPRRVVAGIPHRELETIGRELAEWVHLGGPALEAGEDVWAGSVGLITDDRQVIEVDVLLQRLSDEVLPDVRRELEPVLAALGRPVPGSLGATEKLLEVLADVEALLGRYRPEVLDAELPLAGSGVDPGSAGGAPRRSRRRWRDRRVRRGVLMALADHRLDGTDPSPAEALDDLRSVERIRSAWVELGPGAPPPTAVPPTGAARRVVGGLSEALARLAGYVPSLGSLRSSGTFDDLTRHLGELTADRSALAVLPRVDQLRHRLLARELSPVLEGVQQHRLDPAAAVSLLRRSWSQAVLAELELIDDALGSADGSSLDDAADELAELRRRQRSRSPGRVRSEVAARAASTAADSHAAIEQLRGLLEDVTGPALPADAVIGAAPVPLFAAVPCWSVSPHLVAEVFPLRVGSADERPVFDLVVITGSDRMSVAEAIPALVRARQAVVFGDPRRARSERDASLFAAMAEVLPEPRQMHLRWFHRRGDGRLAALAEMVAGRDPSEVLAVPAPRAEPPLRSVHPDVSTGGQHADDGPMSEADAMAAQAMAVVDLIVEHSVHHPMWSLAVVAMTDGQAERLSAVISEARSDDRALDRFMAGSSAEPVIVRSVAGLAGELRDHIILARGAGSDAGADLDSGVVGVVAAARHLLTVVMSGADEVAVATEQRVGPFVGALDRLLSMAMSGAVPAAGGPVSRPDPVLADIADRLRARRVPVEVVPGRVPELTVQHPAEPGRPLLAVLGDRPAHEVLVSVTDRECLLPEHLARLGWRWHRVRSVDWWRDPESELDRLIEAWQRLH